MTEVLKTSLGKFSAAGAGDVRQGQVGSSTATATVSGAGAVSATVVIMGSNDKVGWQQIGSITVTGNAPTTDQVMWGSDYLYWRADCTVVSAGATVEVVVSTDQSAPSAGDPSTPEGASALRAPMAIKATAWQYVPSISRLRINGTGALSIDSRTKPGGTVTTGVFSGSYANAVDQIEYPYYGDAATQVRATFPDTLKVEVI